MKKIIYINKEVQIGDMVAYNGVTIEVTDKSVEANPSIFKVVDKSLELLDKAKRDYPVGTMFNSKYGAQKVLGDNPFVGIGIEGIIQVNTDRFPGGGTIYTPEDGWCEILPLKFTTEDGVDIYGDMETYLVNPNDDSATIDFSCHALWSGDIERKSYKYFYHKENALAYIEKNKVRFITEDGIKIYKRMPTYKIPKKALVLNKYSLDFWLGNNENYKYFFHKENALAYIEKHKEKTLEDYENSLSLSVWNWFKPHELKLYYTKILQLIADDLNDGRYIHERGQASYHINKERRVTLHMGDDEGAVYFKSKELAEKARDIMGSKLEYLFN